MSRNTGLALAALLALAAGAATAQKSPDVELHMLPVQGNVYMLHAGNAGNIAVQAGPDGVFLVNALRKGLAERIAAEIKTVASAPIRYIVSTSPDVSLTEGNGPLALLGTFGATNASGRPGATLIAQENVLLRLSELTKAAKNPFPGDSVPFDNYILPQKDLYLNGEPIFIFHMPHAHTDGDSIVLFRRSDTLAVGELFVPDEYPVIDVARGGSVKGMIAALDRILDLAVPARLQDGGTRIIPGRGRLCNEADVVDHRDMVAIVRDRVQALIAQGKTLQQIEATRPALDYETRYGNGDVFVRSIYDSLMAAKGAAR